MNLGARIAVIISVEVGFEGDTPIVELVQVTLDLSDHRRGVLMQRDADLDLP